jgi:anti-sigma factor RsiW
VRRRTACQLTALADGSLPPELRGALIRRVAASPQLMRALARQRLAVAAIRGLANPAPASLRSWVNSQE